MAKIHAMRQLEKILRFAALPLSVCIAVVAMWWVWATYPNDESFFLTRILPFYSLYLILTAVCMRVVSAQIAQFLLITLIFATLFMAEICLRVFFGILLF